MLERNLLDEAARVLAMPVPRRKAFKHLAAGFAGALLSFLWPKRATATDYDPPCQTVCGPCTNSGCWGKHVDDPCTVRGKAGHCATYYKCKTGRCCQCLPGPPPDAPAIATIPDVAITREAAAEAIARGKPRLARYIARTAHLVQRTAQV